MGTIDYLKVIDILAKTLQLERIDIRFHGGSTTKLEAILGAEGKAERTFKISVDGYSAVITFPKQYFTAKEFARWSSRFEYECEQAFVKNTSVHMEEDASNYIVTLAI